MPRAYEPRRVALELTKAKVQIQPSKTMPAIFPLYLDATRKTGEIFPSFSGSFLYVAVLIPDFIEGEIVTIECKVRDHKTGVVYAMTKGLSDRVDYLTIDREITLNSSVSVTVDLVEKMVAHCSIVILPE